MSETFPQDSASRFESLHVRIPTDYEAYRAEMVEQWRKNAEDALKNDEPVRPCWLRRNGDSGSEFGAHIDYLMPTANEVRCFASIDIDGSGSQSEIQVWFHMDSATEPLIATRAPYNLDTLASAIELVETVVASGQ